MLSKPLMMLVAVFLVACGAPAPTAVELPTPDGPYAVGVVPLQDAAMTAWYPAEKGTGTGKRVYASLGLLQTLGVKELLVTGNAELNAAPASATTRWPTLILGPGGGSFVELSTSLAEHLASHGYIVIHVQPNAEEENSTRGSLGSDPAAPRAALASEASRQARRRQLSQAIALLEEPLTQSLVGSADPSRLAVAGHSYGGSTAFNASLDDTRIKAAIDLDGTLFEQATTTPVNVPSLVVMAFMFQFLSGANDAGSNTNELTGATLETLRRSSNVVAVALVDAEHYDVTDAALIAPALPQEFRLGGRIGPGATGATNTIALRFLNAVLASPSSMPSAESLIDGVPSTRANVL